ncbi:hypothetical protein KBD81_01710, partial [Candidatus Woesebacteria bacterium]|nr:hypothetical protein [Candidatus Woesebacteria bacterium]
IEEGVNWADYNVKFIFSAEGFSEKFRDYIVKKAKLGNVYTSTLNHYGSVDLGTMAHETPLSIYLRRLTLQDKSLYSSFFSDINKLPTFAQYDPAAFYFEEVNEALYCSSYSGLPLVRYDLKDRGGIYTYDQVSQKLRDNNIDLLESVNSIDLGRKTSTMPFVYVYERSDFIVKLYGANIYPETIRKALLNVGLSNYLTGKFTAEISYDSSHNQYLEVHVELKHGKRPTITLEKRTQDIIVKCLLRENSEFRSNFKESPGRQRPKITLWEYESPTYFMPGVKQKWVKK